MRLRAVAIPLLVLAASLAGCLGSKDDVKPAEDVAPASNNTTLPTAKPDGRDGSFAAFNETNTTEQGMGGLEHHHDYWGGRTHIDIYKGWHEMNPAPYASGTDATIILPEGALVYEGTASVEFTVSNARRHACYERFIGTINGQNTCTDHNGVGAPSAPAVPDPAPPALKLQYRHAAANDWIPLGDVAWGTPLAIPINKPLETDMPHSTTSLWQFKVVSTTPVDTTLVFDVAVAINRGPADIPLWPGHPDFYAKGHFRSIWSGAAETKDYGQRNYNGLTPSVVTTVQPDKLISYGTQTLYVWINITDYKGTPGFEPTTWYLYFHNASGGWNITDPRDATNNTVGKATNLFFTLRVDANGMDTPYGERSRWEFQLRGSLNSPGLGSCYLDCADYEVKYSIDILATDLLAKAYTCGGVGDSYCPKGTG